MLDAGFVCHLGLQTADGPMVLPTSYGRDGDRLYLHGSVASRSLRSALDGVPMCVTVTHVDGVVVARSVFEHALNYRSAIIYGTPEVLTDPADKVAGMHAIAEQIAPGQWGYAASPPTRSWPSPPSSSSRSTRRRSRCGSGPPRDGDGPDADRPVWAGEIPLRTVRLEPRPDPTLRGQVPLPPHLAGPGVAGGAPPWTPGD